MMLLAASATPRPTDSAVPDVQEVVDQMNSNASAEDKTSFLLEYLMAQREPLLNFGKTLLIALIVFLIGKRIIALLLKLLNRWMERSHVEVSVHKFIMSLGRAPIYFTDLLRGRHSWCRHQLDHCNHRIGRSGSWSCSAGKLIESGRWHFDPSDEAVPRW